jgi:hypothetical protein
MINNRCYAAGIRLAARLKHHLIGAGGGGSVEVTWRVFAAMDF